MKFFLYKYGVLSVNKLLIILFLFLSKLMNYENDKEFYFI